MTDISSVLGDNEVLIELGGDINSNDVDGIRGRIEREVSLFPDKRNVVVDLEVVRYANHHFAQFLYDFNQELRLSGRSLVIRSVGSSLFDLFNKYYSLVGDDAPKIVKGGYDSRYC